MNVYRVRWVLDTIDRKSYAALLKRAVMEYHDHFMFNHHQTGRN